jgi:glycolate oxidase FAD binding subunit
MVLTGDSRDVQSAILDVRRTVGQHKGYVIIKHAPLFLRKNIDVWGDKPDHFFLLEGIKSKIDPRRILNDQRFIGGL